MSYPATEIIRVVPSIAIFERYSYFAVSCGEQKISCTERFAQIAWFTRLSTSSIFASVNSPLKSAQIYSPIWKPTLEYPYNCLTTPEKICSPVWFCIKSKRYSQSISQWTLPPTGRKSFVICTIPSFSRCTSITSIPWIVPLSQGCPPPSG